MGILAGSSSIVHSSYGNQRFEDLLERQETFLPPYSPAWDNFQLLIFGGTLGVEAPCTQTFAYLTNSEGAGR